MGKVFCLMGKSSSGKDTIFKELKNDIKLELKPVVGYTTRPKRCEETNGVEYFFITIDELNKYRQRGKIIEERVYNTIKGDWHYCTLDDGQIDSKNNYIIITTLEAYNNLKKYLGDDVAFPIYIDIDDKTRLERAINREANEKKPNYNEVCRRFLADSEDFSEEKLTSSEIEKSYLNIDLEKCLNDIKIDVLKSI